MKLSPAIPQLPMYDISRTEKFYRDVLGFEVKASFPEQNFLMMKRDGAEIHFLGYSEKEAKQFGSVSSFYIYPESVDKLSEELRARGAIFRYGPEDKPWGIYEFQIDDPCGTAVRFGLPSKKK
jgi:catechol 2,3-dioxygenase-like lactoylglutathione lyase family enzyme